MSEHSRRELFQGIAAAALAGSLDPAAAQHVHDAVSAEKKTGPYKPKLFNAAEWKTVGVLCELIVPGASKGNAAEYVDLICASNEALAAAWTGGLAWLDARTRASDGKAFADCPATAQTALLDQIAFRKNDSPQLGPGIRFFDLARRMTVDAYYTSKAGIAELGYKGNVGMSEFQVPQEAIDYALRRGPAA
jgi:gluconate 2-dehydrogenase gamma chain